MSSMRLDATWQQLEIHQWHQWHQHPRSRRQRKQRLQQYFDHRCSMFPWPCDFPTLDHGHQWWNRFACFFSKTWRCRSSFYGNFATANDAKLWPLSFSQGKDQSLTLDMHWIPAAWRLTAGHHEIQNLSMSWVFCAKDPWKGINLWEFQLPSGYLT